MTKPVTRSAADPIQRAMLAIGLAFFAVAVVQGLLSLTGAPAFPPVPWMGQAGVGMLVAEMLYRWIRRWDSRREGRPS